VSPEMCVPSTSDSGFEVSAMAKKHTEASAGGGVFLQPGDEFLSTTKAAEVLDRSAKTLEFWRATGAGPRYYCQGRRIRYLRSDLIRWALRHPVEPGRDTAGTLN
jgi:hypothetical protein